MQFNKGPLQISIWSEVLHVADTSLVMQGRAPSILNNSAQYVLQILYNSGNFEKIFFILVELGPIISWRFALSKNFTWQRAFEN